MSSERERRQAKQREKDRKRDTARRGERAKQRQEVARSAARAGASAAVSPAEARSWPVVEAWIGENWDDGAAAVAGVILRTSGDGRWATAAFRHDPVAGITAPTALLGVPEGAARRPLVDLAEVTPLLACAPGDVAQLLRKARRATDALPDGASPVLDLLDDVDLDDAELDVDPPPRPPPEPAPPGLITRLKQALFG